MSILAEGDSIEVFSNPTELHSAGLEPAPLGSKGCDFVLVRFLNPPVLPGLWRRSRITARLPYCLRSRNYANVMGAGKRSISIPTSGRFTASRMHPDWPGNCELNALPLMHAAEVVQVGSPSIPLDFSHLHGSSLAGRECRHDPQRWGVGLRGSAVSRA